MMCVEPGCGLPADTRERCRPHYRVWYRSAEFSPSRATSGPDYWRQHGNGYLSREREGRTVLQHREVMETYLGRKLCSTENVHHINGDRSDNDISNLELWETSQPAGQRVSDKVAWAKEILRRYAPDWRPK